jgi:hypothetical protein
MGVCECDCSFDKDDANEQTADNATEGGRDSYADKYERPGRPPRHLFARDNGTGEDSAKEVETDNCIIKLGESQRELLGLGRWGMVMRLFWLGVSG